MTELIACLSTGKGTWGHVARLAQESEWEKVILITNEFGQQTFTPDQGKPVELVVIDPNKSLKEMRDEILRHLKEKVRGMEVGLNLVSGTGKEHMAVLGAVLRLGVGIRLVALTKDGMEEV